VLAGDAPLVFAEYRLCGTMLGAWRDLGFAPTNARLDVRGVDSYEFRGELLCRCTTLDDSLDAARQLGILPANASGSARLLARAQNVQARFRRHRAQREGPRLPAGPS
jgi:hypothetical protein